ncbi:Coenzyme Q-binding protein coq10, mitochondrial [Friedmanniomyces endolithicus]|nr:Coenzyme Q-binding protein coq10, mitochondrial [Friedmanniomyces endolithicus]
MADLLSSAWGPPVSRRVTHSKTLPYHPSTVFNAATDIPAYSSFLSLVQSSAVTSKDSHGLPKAAKLNVGYPRFGIEEDWPCRVTCDKTAGSVKIVKGGGNPEANEGVLEEWMILWKIQPSPGTAAGNGAIKTAEVEFTVEVKFRSNFYDQAFALLPNIAERVMEVDQAERKKRVAMLKEKAKLAAAQREKAKEEAAKKESAKQSQSSAKIPPKKLEVRVKSNGAAGPALASSKKASG